MLIIVKSYNNMDEGFVQISACKHERTMRGGGCLKSDVYYNKGVKMPLLYFSLFEGICCYAILGLMTSLCTVSDT